MPRASRFMKDELSYLKAEAGAYGDARVGKSLRTFWGRVLPEFFAKFPRALPDGWKPGDPIVQAGSTVQDGVDADSADEADEEDADDDNAIEGADDASSGQTSATNVSSREDSVPSTNTGEIRITKRVRSPEEIRAAALGALVTKKTKVSLLPQ